MVEFPGKYILADTFERTACWSIGLPQGLQNETEVYYHPTIGWTDELGPVRISDGDGFEWEECASFWTDASGDYWSWRIANEVEFFEDPIAIGRQLEAVLYVLEYLIRDLEPPRAFRCHGHGLNFRLYSRSSS